ncbi:hypothetical protein J4411_01985 [Candidatus Pacearchaeota archaeon]|nr:hypothetical protein [Candidatus Pacearchaeota archaeon]
MAVYIFKETQNRNLKETKPISFYIIYCTNLFGNFKVGAVLNNEEHIEETLKNPFFNGKVIKDKLPRKIKSFEKNLTRKFETDIGDFEYKADVSRIPLDLISG